MKTTPLGLDQIQEYGATSIMTYCPNLSDEASAKLERALKRYILGQVTFTDAQTTFVNEAGNTKPLEIMRNVFEALKAPPLPYVFEHPRPHDQRKQRHWTTEEDNRLVAGVYLYGTNDWNNVSNFVGAGRGRPQCLQRWTRTLNPQITKSVWSPEEEQRLLSIINEMDKISWTKVANQMGNRSDVQCRYHYGQLKKRGVSAGDISPQSSTPRSPIPGQSLMDSMVLSFNPIPVLTVVDYPMNVDRFLSCFKKA